MLNAEALQSLTDVEKSRLLEFEKTFGTKGWEQIKDWAEKSAEEQLVRLQYAQDWDTFQLTRNAMFLFQSFANLEEETYKEFERIGFGRLEDQMVQVELEHE